MGAPYKSRAMRTTSMARTTPAQNPRGFKRMTFFTSPLARSRLVGIGISCTRPEDGIFGDCLSITRDCPFGYKDVPSIKLPARQPLLCLNREEPVREWPDPQRSSRSSSPDRGVHERRPPVQQQLTRARD